MCYFNFNFMKLASDILPSQPRKGNLGNPTSSVSFWGSKSIFICIAASEVDTWCYLFVRHTWYVTIIWSGDSKSKCLKRMSASVFTTCCLQLHQLSVEFLWHSNCEILHGSQVYNLWSCPQQEVQWRQVAKFLAWKLAGENDFGVWLCQLHKSD